MYSAFCLSNGYRVSRIIVKYLSLEIGPITVVGNVITNLTSFSITGNCKVMEEANNRELPAFPILVGSCASTLCWGGGGGETGHLSLPTCLYFKITPPSFCFFFLVWLCHRSASHSPVASAPCSLPWPASGAPSSTAVWGGPALTQTTTAL